MWNDKMIWNNKNLLIIISAATICWGATDSFGATTQRVAVRRPTAVAQVAQTPKAPSTTLQHEPETLDVTEAESVPAPVVEIYDKSSQFSLFMNSPECLGTALSSGESSGESALAAAIRKQTQAIANSENTMANTATIKATQSDGTNKCDSGLRKCMQDKCGAEYTKCANDADTTWGNKMDLCRATTTCSGAEYAAFAPEIKSDRDLYAKLASYKQITDCGNRYNDCMVTQCGPTFSKCLSKSVADNAISKCSSIARECQSADSGLATRMGSIFGTLRTTAEKQIAQDEKRLYELRDKMESQCSMLGAMFDTRTLDCVFTVNFFANNSETPYASKKAYAGTVFQCNPDWFGIDVTTFKENAYRLTRSQTAASSAMLGSGVGIAAGAISSGAINRAIDTKKAKTEKEKAECANAGGEWNGFLGTCTKNTASDGGEKTGNGNENGNGNE